MQIEILTSQDLEGLKADLTRIIAQELKSAIHNTSNEYLTSKQVCKLLNIAPKTLQSYRDEKLMSFSQVGSKIFYKRSDVDDFIETNKVRSWGHENRKQGRI